MIQSSPKAIGVYYVAICGGNVKLAQARGGRQFVVSSDIHRRFIDKIASIHEVR